jgi:UDP-N-acetylmuramyl pentapeptide phosphotransferase/UDP-N-acetylglucosamine-1-phosphate transferase
LLAGFEFWFDALLFFAGGFLSVWITLPFLLKVLRDTPFQRPNYQGKFIPVGAGLVFFAGASFSAVCYSCLFKENRLSAVILFIVALFTLLGFLDDLAGNRSVTGLAGHLKSALRGRLTTGVLKAGGGLAGTTLAASFCGPWPLFAVYAFVFALSANAVNLLDVRPGRAGKAFIFFAFAFAAAGWGKKEALFLFGFLGSVAAYLRADLKARAMMGDTGANALGAVLGLGAVLVFSKPLVLAYLALLIFVHLLAEKKSLSEIIAGNKVLNFLDRLGRDLKKEGGL